MPRASTSTQSLPDFTVELALHLFVDVCARRGCIFSVSTSHNNFWISIRWDGAVELDQLGASMWLRVLSKRPTTHHALHIASSSPLIYTHAPHTKCVRILHLVSRLLLEVPLRCKTLLDRSILQDVARGLRSPSCAHGLLRHVRERPYRSSARPPRRATRTARPHQRPSGTHHSHRTARRPPHRASLHTGSGAPRRGSPQPAALTSSNYLAEAWRPDRCTHLHRPKRLARARPRSAADQPTAPG